VSGGWVWFRNYFRRKQVGEEITLFVERLVVALHTSISIHDCKKDARGKRIIRVAYPAPFETVLRAEEAVQAHLQTCRALERAGVLGTFESAAFSGCNFRRHV
jgi:hypothetical protein